jgi:hypothetical protein
LSRAFLLPFRLVRPCYAAITPCWLKGPLRISDDGTSPRPGQQGSGDGNRAHGSKSGAKQDSGHVSVAQVRGVVWTFTTAESSTERSPY